MPTEARHDDITATEVTAELSIAAVIQARQGVVVLSCGRKARRATSCLVQVCAGDKVLCVEEHDEVYILSVLSRSGTPDLEIQPEEGNSISLVARHVNVQAASELKLQAGREISIAAPLGKLTVVVHDLFQTVHQSLVSHARNWFSRADHVDHRADKLLRSHAMHQVLTADREIRVDASRINMG